MNILQRHKSILFAFMVMILMPLAALLLNNCGGSDSYTVSDAQRGTVQVMISPATLNSWAENGYGTDSLGYNKLVVLDVDSAAGYAAGHIPGSYNLDTDTDLQTTRSNGVTFTISQVPTKAMMDALIQRTGIDARTVVALVGNSTMMNVGRAYFNFRYWGFPRERLRVLNGTKNATYRDASGYSLSTTATPLPAPSTYSVANLTPNAFETRASMEDMIAYAGDNDPFTVIIDARSADEYRGVGRKTTTATSGTYVAFEGHVRTAEHQEYVELHEGGNRANPLLSKNELVTAMAAINMNEDSTGISYCRTSWRAAIQFLALDAVLGWKAKIYDGAWIEWGQMATNDPARDGSLDPASPWRTDNANLTESLTYNRQIVAPVAGANSFAASANVINETDKAICGGAGTQPQNRAVDVMIDPVTLIAWVDAGAPNDPADGPGDNPYPGDYSNFVILHVDSQANYNAGHIPGAFHFDTSVDLSATRSDGVVDTISQVATSAQMDDLIQRTGIGADTIIVFYTTNNSSGSSLMSLGRAYFNFRYWGFPRERLRVLDGTTNHWLTAGGDALVTDPTTDVSSTYSVCNLRQDIPLPNDTLAPPDKVRASFEEMVDVAGDADPSTIVADSRSADEYAGYIGKTSVGGGAYVAFEGHVRTAEHQEWNTLITSGDNIGWKLLPNADLTTAMNAIGADDTTTVYSYCRTSWRAAVNFLALDAALGWPTKIYDGAWIEWGQMATNDTTVDGSLDPLSPWRTDNDLTESKSYNKGLGLVLPVAGADSFAPHANLINVEDAGTAATGGGTSGGGGSSQPQAPGYN